MKRIFISGPFTAPTEEGKYANVVAAIRAGEWVKEQGACPFIPHLFATWDAVFPGPYEQWMALCKEELLRSDALYRLGPSPGADKEFGWANDALLPVLTSKEEVLAWLNK